MSVPRSFTYRTELVTSDAAVEMVGIYVYEPRGEMTYWSENGHVWAQAGTVYVRTSGTISIVPFVGADQRMLGVLRGTATDVWRGEQPSEDTAWTFHRHETGEYWSTVVSVMIDDSAVAAAIRRAAEVERLALDENRLAFLELSGEGR
ncbi:hypothetical protein [Rhodococcus sp. USK13]|uniref:hypothetical protein n=1 Tax=Rhodococcus sp. USK13 TaxID=2806442 RepID=UPI001BCDA383|nr:hypothetical protein [Rhodococcus sp. USK13]